MNNVNNLLEQLEEIVVRLNSGENTNSLTAQQVFNLYEKAKECFSLNAERVSLFDNKLSADLELQSNLRQTLKSSLNMDIKSEKDTKAFKDLMTFTDIITTGVDKTIAESNVTNVYLHRKASGYNVTDVAKLLLYSLQSQDCLLVSDNGYVFSYSDLELSNARYLNLTNVRDYATYTSLMKQGLKLYKISLDQVRLLEYANIIDNYNFEVNMLENYEELCDTIHSSEKVNNSYIRYSIRKPVYKITLANNSLSDIREYITDFMIFNEYIAYPEVEQELLTIKESTLTSLNNHEVLETNCDLIQIYKEYLKEQTEFTDDYINENVEVFRHLASMYVNVIRVEKPNQTDVKERFVLSKDGKHKIVFTSYNYKILAKKEPFAGTFIDVSMAFEQSELIIKLISLYETGLTPSTYPDLFEGLFKQVNWSE